MPIMASDSALTEEEWSHESRFVVTSAKTSNAYLIETYSPCQVPPEGGFPVLYCLDGNALFHSACDLARLIANPRKLHPDMRPVLVVAIGYPERKAFHETQRARDFTPPPTAMQAEALHYPLGGAEDFISFLEGELKPIIAARFCIDAQQQCLFGHSLGGLFALHAYLHHPQSYSKFISASPSVWYNDFELVTLQEGWLTALRESGEQARPLMVTFGSLEGVGPSKRPLSETQVLRDKLVQAFAGLHATQPVWVYSHPGEHHITNLFASLPKAVVFTACQSMEACRILLDGC